MLAADLLSLLTTVSRIPYTISPFRNTTDEKRPVEPNKRNRSKNGVVDKADQ
jgi:hypothetical protein